MQIRMSMGLMKYSRTHSYNDLLSSPPRPYLTQLSSWSSLLLISPHARLSVPRHASYCLLLGLCCCSIGLECSFPLFPYLAPHPSNLCSYVTSSEKPSPNTRFLIIASICNSPVFFFTVDYSPPKENESPRKAGVNER